MPNKFQEIAFTPSVKAAQTRHSSRRHFERIGSAPGRNVVLGDAETEFIESVDGFFMATVGEQGQPYIQFRGGPRGFLKVLDDRTIGFADFRGNLQYISVGNLEANSKAALFLLDYAHRRRLKIFATAEVKGRAEFPELVERLTIPGYKAVVERVMVFTVEGFDWNCPQHITPRYTIEEIREMTRPLNEYIAKLENEVAGLKAAEGK